MYIRDWYEMLEREHSVSRSNRVYGLLFRFLDEKKTDMYLEQIEINPKYRGRGYLKRILTNLCKEFHCSITLNCVPELAPMYSHIGCFTLMPEEKWFYSDLVEFYFDPLGINY